MEETTFEYRFVDESERRRISFEFNETDDEVLRFGVLDDGHIHVAANRSGFLALAKLCIKLASGSYRDGFHSHLGQDFDDPNVHPNLVIGFIDEASGISP